MKFEMTGSLLALIHLDCDCSVLTKQDSRCWHTYVYNVHKVSLL